MLNKRLKILTFWLLMLVPGIVLLFLLVDLAVSIVAVNLNIDSLTNRIEASLEAKTGQPFDFTTQDGVRGFWTTDAKSRFIFFEPEKNTCNIYAFGGSSLVEPDFDRAFPARLQTLLSEAGRPCNVTNFGVPGYDSFSVLNRVKTALAAYPPDLLIVYSGHNDYTYNFRQDLAKRLFLVQNSHVLNMLIRLYFAKVYAPKHAIPPHMQDQYYDVFLNQFVEPPLFAFILNMGLIDLDADDLDSVYALVLQHYRKNIEEIANLSHKAGAALLLITPVGNLAMEPYGLDGRSADHYRKAEAARDYRTRIGHLIAARDLDAFNLDIRAKTPLLDLLRHWRAPGVSTLDLEHALIACGFAFGNEEYIDFVHFAPWVHDLYARFILRHLAQNDLCCGLGAFDAPEPDCARKQTKKER